MSEQKMVEIELKDSEWAELEKQAADQGVTVEALVQTYLNQELDKIDEQGIEVLSIERR